MNKSVGRSKGNRRRLHASSHGTKFSGILTFSAVFSIWPCAESYFRNGVCRLSYHASMRPLEWIRYSIRSPNRDAALHMFFVVETHLKSLSRNDNNDKALLHLYLLRTSDKKRKLSFFS